LDLEQRLRELAAAEATHIGSVRRQPPRFDDGGITEVLLIRHGLTEPREWRGDPPLNDLGLDQAAVLATFLASHKILGAVISSPLQRCLQTARAIANAQGLAVETNADLREIENYAPEGKTLREVVGEEGWAAMEQSLLDGRRWQAPSIYESGESLRARSVAAVDDAIARYPERRIAIVTHGPVINAYLASLLQSPFDIVTTTSLTGVSTVWATGDRRAIRALNSVAHFRHV
jgi:broad specificity phosphatase PhoE